MSEEKLADLLKNGKDWSRIKTSVPSIFVIKLPKYRSSPARLTVELNPVDESGSPKKKRGLVLRSTAELQEFRRLFDDEKLPKLLSMIESVNPKVEGAAQRKEGVIEL